MNDKLKIAPRSGKNYKVTNWTENHSLDDFMDDKNKREVCKDGRRSDEQRTSS